MESNVTLNNGIRMPQFGLGVWQSTMLDRMGIIGRTQGVKVSASPARKNKPMMLPSCALARIAVKLLSGEAGKAVFAAALDLFCGGVADRVMV